MSIFRKKETVTILVVFLLLVGFLATARADEAQQFGQKVQRAYEATPDLSMDFTQKTYVAILEREDSKKGSAKFKKPGKFSISYEGAHGRQYISNGKTLWIYEQGDPQVQSIPLSEDTIPAEALSFLGGLGNLKNDFAVEEVDPKKWEQLKAGKGSLRWLELTPLQKRSTIQWLIMGFDKETGLAQEVYIFTDSENISHYLFSNLRGSTGIADSLFEFSKVGKK